MGRHKSEESRNWAFILWDEVAKPDWRVILTDQEKLIWCCSPYHDKDIYPNGERKPPHYHVVVMFEGNKSLEQMQILANKLYGPPTEYLQRLIDEGIEPHGQKPIPVNTLRGMIRYFIHIDDPEKYQYKREEIYVHGCEVDQYFGWSKTDIDKATYEMKCYIIEHEIVEFNDFIYICMNNPLWDHIITDVKSLFFKNWLYNRSMLKKQGKQL